MARSLSSVQREFESTFDPHNSFKIYHCDAKFFFYPSRRELKTPVSFHSFHIIHFIKNKQKKKINKFKSSLPLRDRSFMQLWAHNKPVQIQAEASDAENVMQMISQGGGDMWQEATPGTCVPCLPGEIEPWAECLWVWRNYRLGGRLTCLWHQRRQPRRRWRKPAVVIVHKLRRHVFEEFMRWLYCTHGGISPRGVSCPEHTTTRGRVGRPVPVCAPLSTTEFGLLLSLPPYAKSWICHRGPIMFAEVVFTSPVIARGALPPHSPSRRWISDVGSRYLFVPFSTDCFRALSFLSRYPCVSWRSCFVFFWRWIGFFLFFLIGDSKFQSNDEWLSSDLKWGQLVRDDT